MSVTDHPDADSESGRTQIWVQGGFALNWLFDRAE
jgi:hypothetical protein